VKANPELVESEPGFTSVNIAPTTCCTMPGSRTFVITSPAIKTTSTPASHARSSRTHQPPPASPAGSVSAGTRKSGMKTIIARMNARAIPVLPVRDIPAAPRTRPPEPPPSPLHRARSSAVALCKSQHPPGRACPYGRSQEHSSSRTRSRACGTALPSDRQTARTFTPVPAVRAHPPHSPAARNTPETNGFGCSHPGIR